MSINMKELFDPAARKAEALGHVIGELKVSGTRLIVGNCEKCEQSAAFNTMTKQLYGGALDRECSGERKGEDKFEMKGAITGRTVSTETNLTEKEKENEMSKKKAKKSVKKKTAKKSKKAAAKRERKPGLGSMICDMLVAKKSVKEILRIVKAKFPKAKTNEKCVSWYRSKLVKEGKLKKAAKK